MSAVKVVKFESVQRPTLDAPGTQKVLMEYAGVNGKGPKTVVMGMVSHTRAANDYEGSFLDAKGELQKLRGTFDTRSQAGHAVARAFEAERTGNVVDIKAPKGVVPIEAIGSIVAKEVAKALAAQARKASPTPKLPGTGRGRGRPRKAA